MKKILLFNLITISFVQFISFKTIGQTNVSGGIYVNTTWTQANSPYIVTDTIVVFPNVTLTIEPGVTVKFADSVSIELRQAKLIAVGTFSDSIIFTSNSSFPYAGIYSGIYLNGGAFASTFNYCHFNYANVGINASSIPDCLADSIIVDNSNFDNNITGLQFFGCSNFQVALIDSSNFSNNTSFGVYLKSVRSAAISYCNFNFNNSDGLIMENPNSQYFSSMLYYCNFSHNTVGILWNINVTTIDHCLFTFNGSGMDEFGSLSNFLGFNLSMRNSIFDYNQTAAYLLHFSVDSCIFSNNQTGIISENGVIINSVIDSNSVLGISSFSDYIGNCKLRYNATGINSENAIVDGNIIEHSTGTNINTTALGGQITTITGNTISYGSSGINNNAGSYIETLYVTNNIIENNDTGIILNNSVSTIRCNTICNNTTYNLTYGAISNADARFNYWCMTDSTSIEATIYDGYDNISYGLVTITPIDSACILFNSVQELETNNSIIIYPNPASNFVSINYHSTNANTLIKIFNVLGIEIYSQKLINEDCKINIENWSRGIYFVEVNDGDKNKTKKLLIE